MPGGADTKEFAKRGELPGASEPADIGDMDPDEIEEALLNQRHIFMDIDVELAHCDRCARVLAQKREVAVVFRREGVLQKKELELVEIAGEIDRLHRGDALVDIVQQLDL